MTFKKNHKSLIIKTLCLALPLSIEAQISNQTTAVRITEQEVQLQDKYMAAVVQQQIGKLEGAATLFSEVLAKNPKCDGCAFQLSRLYTSMEKKQEAIDLARVATKIDPQNKWYQMQLAESLERIGKDRDAADVYRNLAENKLFENDFSEEIYFRLAFAQVRMGEPQKAIKTLDELEKKTGVDEDISDKKHTIYD